jgi:hypothetical protein
VSNPIRRRPDGSVITPNAQEPHCTHPGGEGQPASACSVCKDGEALADWRRQWATYIAENPNSEAARWVRAQERETPPPPS